MKRERIASEAERVKEVVADTQEKLHHIMVIYQRDAGKLGQVGPYSTPVDWATVSNGRLA